MPKFVVIVFPGETQAYEGTRALQKLRAERNPTLSDLVVVARDAEGNFDVKP